MTGYGRSVLALGGREITVELKAVNNRYLDCSVRLPRIFSFAEDAIRQRVKQAVARGKVDVFVTVNMEASDDVDIRVNRPVLEGYLAAMRSIAADYEVRDDISVCALSRLPDVFTVEKADLDEEAAVRDLLTVTDEALAAFNAMREREGEALAADLRSHLGQLETMLENGGPIGRKLDFLMQEMNREINTVGSKCSDLDLARTVVEVKAELEKIREQMQNIE